EYADRLYRQQSRNQCSGTPARDLAPGALGAGLPKLVDGRALCGFDHDENFLRSVSVLTRSKIQVRRAPYRVEGQSRRVDSRSAKQVQHSIPRQVGVLPRTYREENQ